MTAVRNRLLNPVVVVSIVLWVTAYVGLVGMAISSRVDAFEQVLLVRVITCSIGAALCGWLYLILRPIRDYSFLPQILVALAAITVIAALWTLIDQIVQQACGFIAPVEIDDFIRRTFAIFHWSMWIYLTWCLIYFTIEYRSTLIAREVDLAQVRTLALDAQNRMLRYQLNPHFLFNTLNALSALVLDNRRDQAEHVLLALSRFLRYSLEQDPTAKTPLAAEIAAQEEYMAIEQIRFGDKLHYVKSIEPKALQALVPCFILQPAVENSIKYAVGPSNEPVTIELSAHIRGDELVLSVRDDGAHGKFTKSVGLGVGLENVKRRLSLLYGSNATITASKLDLGGFKVEVALPVEWSEERPIQRPVKALA